MNQADDARANMEIKTLLDRTIPLVENGKGCKFFRRKQKHTNN